MRARAESLAHLPARVGCSLLAHMKIAAAITIATILTAAPASVQPAEGKKEGEASASAHFADGNKLHEACKSEEVAAVSYVIGVVDSAVLFQQLSGVKDRVCIPDDVDATQVQNVACKYLEDNPEIRHRLAAEIVTESLASTWPCK